MSKPALAPLFALCAVLPVLACDAGAPAPADPTNTGEAKAEQAPAAAVPDTDKEQEQEQEPKSATAEVPEGGVSTPPAPGEPPPWFTPDAFPSAKVIRNTGRSTPLPSGQSSSMILLELEAGTTAEQCMELVRAKLGETIPDLPASIESPQGYPMLQGKTATYNYNVVCGVAKGTPTMMLSHVQ